MIKLSEKDDVLLKHLIEKLKQWNPKVPAVVSISPMLKDCDAYIATGSNNSARYFHHYFGKYPSVIRSNKTSVAVLTGEETLGQLTFWQMMFIFILVWAAEMLPKFMCPIIIILNASECI